MSSVPFSISSSGLGFSGTRAPPLEVLRKPAYTTRSSKGRPGNVKLQETNPAGSHTQLEWEECLQRLANDFCWAFESAMVPPGHIAPAFYCFRMASARSHPGPGTPAAWRRPRGSDRVPEELDQPGIVQDEVTGALSHLQLARAQKIMGNEAAARRSYEDFLSLWKDADSNIPIYQNAKAEYALLRKNSN